MTHYYYPPADWTYTSDSSSGVDLVAINPLSYNSAIKTIAVQSASAHVGGVLTNGTQQIAGAKEFMSIPKTVLTAPTLPEELATKSYVDGAISGGASFIPLAGVNEFADAQGYTPADGWRLIQTITHVGTFTKDYIYQYASSGGTWTETIPVNDNYTYVDAEGVTYIYSSSAGWVTFEMSLAGDAKVNTLSVSSTTQSTSTVTGCATFVGGVGIEKRLNVGESIATAASVNATGNLNADGRLTVGLGTAGSFIDISRSQVAGGYPLIIARDTDRLTVRASLHCYPDSPLYLNAKVKMTACDRLMACPGIDYSYSREGVYSIEDFSSAPPAFVLGRRYLCGKGDEVTYLHAHIYLCEGVSTYTDVGTISSWYPLWVSSASANYQRVRNDNELTDYIICAPLCAMSTSVVDPPTLRLAGIAGSFTGYIDIYNDSGDLRINCSGDDVHFDSTDIIHINSTTASSSKTTGSLICAGGVGISGALYAGETTADSLTTAGKVVCTDPTISTSKTTGALVITGGIGCSDGIYCGRITSDSLVRFTNATASSSKTTGALVCSGGVGIAGALYAGACTADSLSTAGVISCTNSTASISKTTGALTVTGGVGVQGIIVADRIYARSSSARSLPLVNWGNVAGTSDTSIYQGDHCAPFIWSSVSTPVMMHKLFTVARGIVPAASYGLETTSYIYDVFDGTTAPAWVSGRLYWCYKTGAPPPYSFTAFDVYECTGSVGSETYTSVGAPTTFAPIQVTNYTPTGRATWLCRVNSTQSLACFTYVSGSTIIGISGQAENCPELKLLDTSGNNITLTNTSGDLYINCSGNDLYIDATDIVHLSSTAAASSKTTGALICSGGVGISGALYAGATTVDGLTVLGTQTITSTSSPQFTVGYDGTNKATFAISSGGNLTIAPSSGNLILTGALTANVSGTSTAVQGLWNPTLASSDVITTYLGKDSGSYNHLITQFYNIADGDTFNRAVMKISGMTAEVRLQKNRLMMYGAIAPGGSTSGGIASYFDDTHFAILSSNSTGQCILTPSHGTVVTDGAISALGSITTTLNSSPQLSIKYDGTHEATIGSNSAGDMVLASTTGEISVTGSLGASGSLTGSRILQTSVTDNFEDLQLVGQVRVGGSAPSFSQISTTGTYAYSFSDSVVNIVYAQTQVPHSADGYLVPHIHVTGDYTTLTGGSNVSRWTLDLVLWRGNDPTQQKITISETKDFTHTSFTNAWSSQMFSFSAIDLAGYAVDYLPSGCFTIALSRVGNATQDTLPYPLFLIGFDFHYRISQLGGSLT